MVRGNAKTLKKPSHYNGKMWGRPCEAFCTVAFSVAWHLPYLRKPLHYNGENVGAALGGRGHLQTYFLNQLL